MKDLSRIVPWCAGLVTVYQLAVYVALLIEHPGLLILSLLGMIIPLGLGAVFFALDDLLDAFGAHRRVPLTPPHRALGWMLLSCVPLWPVILTRGLGLNSGNWVDVGVGITFAAAAVRYVHEDGLRWSIPLILTVIAGLLAVSARELMPGCVLVSAVLALHTVTSFKSKGEPL